MGWKRKAYMLWIALIAAMVGISACLCRGWEEQDFRSIVKDAGKNRLTESMEAENTLEAEEDLWRRQLLEKKAGDVLEEGLLTEERRERLFYSTDISEEIWQRIWGISYQENEVISLEELRYLRVLHRGGDGKTYIGELIVHEKIASDVLEIMEELYENDYPIERMVLVDEYYGSDEDSMEDNNTSAFCYRVIAGTAKLSNHSRGLAIDVNPKYNPYVKEQEGEGTVIRPKNGKEYADRSQEFPYKIVREDLCCRLFLEHGFSWGGDWNTVKDYQHFEKETAW